jgi:hypothetical protein
MLFWCVGFVTFCYCGLIFLARSKVLCVCVCVCVVVGFELRASLLPGRHSATWATPPALFCIGYFQARVSRTICLGWPWTMILLITVSWVARITGVSHQEPCSETRFWRVGKVRTRTLDQGGPSQMSDCCNALMHSGLRALLLWSPPCGLRFEAVPTLHMRRKADFQ